MLQAFSRAVTRAVDFFIEANVEHAVQKRKLNSTNKNYSAFRKEFYHAADNEVFKHRDRFRFDKWVSMSDMMLYAHKASSIPVMATLHDREKYVSKFINRLRTGLQTGEIEGYKSDEVDSIDGFYLWGLDVYRAIIDADLPDGGEHHRAASYHTKETRNEEIPRPIFVDGQEHEEWLNFKHPLIYALATADDCSNMLPRLHKYSLDGDGAVKTLHNSPYLP